MCAHQKPEGCNMKSGRRFAVVALLAGAVAAGMYAWLKPPPSKGPTSGTAAVTGASGTVLPAASGAQSNQPPSQKLKSSSGTSTPVARSFVQSRNLAQFVTENSEKAKNGDGERAMLIAAAYQECMSFGVDPAAYVEMRRQMYERQPKEMATDRQRFDDATQRAVARCAELNQQHDRQKQIDQWIAMGAKAGNLSAQIAAIQLSSEPLSATRTRDLLTDVVSSQDPEAISQLGNLMSLGISDDKSQFQRFGGNMDANYAWQLAACAFGMDCSADGPKVQQICQTSGMCAFSSLE